MNESNEAARPESIISSGKDAANICSSQSSVISEIIDSSLPSDFDEISEISDLLRMSEIIIKAVRATSDGSIKDANHFAVEALASKLGNASESAAKFKGRAANFCRSPSVFMVKVEGVNTIEYEKKGYKKRICQDAFENLVHRNCEFLDLKVSSKSQDPGDIEFRTLCWSNRHEFFKTFVIDNGRVENIMPVLKNIVSHVAK